jgi:pyruvate dehydrogenase complex dehydrogenase (E1) component
VVATLAALAADGKVKPGVVAQAIERFGIEPEKVEPREA